MTAPAPIPPSEPTLGMSVRDRLAWRRVKALVARRRVRAQPRPLPERHVLAVLPSEEAAAREAWRFLERLGWPAEQVVPVVAGGGDAPGPPAAFVGRVALVTARDRGVLGLPKRAFRERLWSSEPDLTLYLRDDLDLGLALLVAAAPASMRAGLFPESAAPLFDLAAKPGPAGLRTLDAVLRRVQPAAVPAA